MNNDPQDTKPDPPIIKGYKGTEQSNNPIQVGRWFNPHVRISMLGDLAARPMPTGQKLKWLLVLVLWPFGISSYYYGVYSKAPQTGYKTEVMESGKTINKAANDIEFYFMLTALLIGLLVAAVFGIRYLLIK